MRSVTKNFRDGRIDIELEGVERMYGVFHRRRILWGLLIGLCCLLLPFLSGMAAKELAEEAEPTHPVGMMEVFWESFSEIL